MPAAKPRARFSVNTDNIGYPDEVWVRCPRCRSCALVSRAPARRSDPASDHIYRLVCRRCGHSDRQSAHSLIPYRMPNPPVDAPFGMPLWLQTRCCGENLWAFNAQHLGLIERYISADLRERYSGPGGARSNSNLFSRLPRWMILARNRDKVLKGLARLRERLVTAA